MARKAMRGILSKTPIYHSTPHAFAHNTEHFHWACVTFVAFFGAVHRPSLSSDATKARTITRLLLQLGTVDETEVTDLLSRRPSPSVACLSLTEVELSAGDDGGRNDCAMM